jgi:hypothetical protein
MLPAVGEKIPGNFLKPVINCVSAHHVNYQRRKTKLKKLIKKMRWFL